MSEDLHHTIDVRFYEGDNDEPFAVSNIPIGQLPDTFEVDTVLNLGGQDWQVLRATPARKQAFAQSGVLEIVLARYVVDPKEILYSLPSIGHDLPEMEPLESFDKPLVLHEDDWRQCEFVAHSFELHIQFELQAILNIYENHREGPGFKHLHLRKEIAEPLTGTALTLQALEQSFEFAKRYDAVALNNGLSKIVGGFGFQTASGWIFWGQVDANGAMTALNLVPFEQANVADISDEIDAFMAKHNLHFVDWPRVFWCNPGEVSFAEYGE